MTAFQDRRVTAVRRALLRIKHLGNTQGHSEGCATTGRLDPNNGSCNCYIVVAENALDVWKRETT